MRVEYKPVVLPGAVYVLLPTGTFSVGLAKPVEGFGDVSFRAGGGSTVNSPMPGKVTKFLVAPGTAVTRGQNVLIVEAMKMEHLVKAPMDGTISFCVREGDMCGADQVLAKFTE
jgi:biotin carboxyl carrier protein